MRAAKAATSLRVLLTVMTPKRSKNVYLTTRALSGWEAANKVVADANLTWDDIDIIIPHQANLRIVDSAAKRIGITTERMFINVDKYGNTSGASIPIALCEARDCGRLKHGDKAVLVGFGGGLTWGAALIEY